MEQEYIDVPGQSQEVVPLGALVAGNLHRVVGLGKEEDYHHPLDGGGKMKPRLFLTSVAALFLATGTAQAFNLADRMENDSYKQCEAKATGFENA